MSAYKLIVGLDYGTTCTGVSFCQTSSYSQGRENIEVINDYPAQNNRIGTKEKVPSEVAYKDDGIVWGSLIPSNVPRHMWTKLQLDNINTGKAGKIMREISTTLKNTNQPVEIIADFLSQIKTILIQNLGRKFGKELWKTLPITLVITVPAVWSDLAKARTREAVEKAGFNQLEFPQLKEILMATEPECAAIYTIKNVSDTFHDVEFAVGDSFIVCDMGGGTVDLIAYRIASLKPTRIEEATVGSGAQCGGTFVDRAFLGWLEKRIGTEEFVKIAGCRSEEVPHTSLTRQAAKLLQDFVMDAKTGFSGTETSYIPLPPGSIMTDLARGVKEGEMTIMAEDMIDMFDGPLRKTYELLGKQLGQLRKKKKNNVKFVFMVGGFAESPYMYKKIEEYVEDQEEDGKIQVIRPPYAWSAIARGAAAKGIEGDGLSVTSRKCRRHYGTNYDPNFMSHRHRETDAFYSEYTGEKLARDQMHWLIKTGQDLPANKSAHGTTSFFTNFWPDVERKTTLELYASIESRAPVRLQHKGVFVVAKVFVDLTGVPDDEYECHQHPIKGAYFSLEYDMEIAIKSTIEYSLLVGGKRYKSITAKYE